MTGWHVQKRWRVVTYDLLGEMVALGLETVLVGDVVEGVFLSVSGNPSDGSTDDQSLLLGSNVLKLGLF
jgi:hypothetical protein